MYGANYLGQPQYGQGPAIFIPPTPYSISVTVTCTPTLNSSQITNKIITVTCNTTASILRQLNRRLTTTVTVTSTLTTGIARTLKLIAATTKFLTAATYTITATVADVDAYFQADYFQNDYFQIGSFSVVGGTATITKNITPERTTNKIDD